MAQQTQQANQQLAQQLNKPPSALEQAKEAEQTGFLQQTPSPDFDITKVSGMSPYMNLFNRAKANDLSSETPLPSGATWGGATNTGLSQALAAQGARGREQEAAGGLEQAFGAKNAAMRGETLPFLAYQQQRNLSLMDALNNRSLNLYGLYGRSITTPSVFTQFMMNAANNAARGAAMA